MPTSGWSGARRRRLKVPLVVGRAAVRELARKQKLSLEMAARELRHGFLARTARRRHIPTVALAHHADDQLELFFLRLLRGSGGEGLAGMKWRTPSASDADDSTGSSVVGSAEGGAASSMPPNTGSAIAKTRATRCWTFRGTASGMNCCRCSDASISRPWTRPSRA